MQMFHEQRETIHIGYYAYTLLCKHFFLNTTKSNFQINYYLKQTFMSCLLIDESKIFQFLYAEKHVY